MALVSQNGWPVDPPRRSRLVAGTPDVRVTVADGPAGDVLMHVLAQLHARVEPLTLDGTDGALDDWGYAPRPIRGSTETSNHASATAVDANATRHPLGAEHTFTATQRAEIHRILAEVDQVVRWGGDYTGRKDEMHFEINAGQDAVARVATRLAQQAQPEPAPIQKEEDDMSVAYVRGDSRVPIPGTKNVYGDIVFLCEWDVREGATRARVVSPADPGYQLWAALGRPIPQVPQAVLDAVITITPKQAATLLAEPQEG
jgi:hypothetical protein